MRRRAVVLLSAVLSAVAVAPPAVAAPTTTVQRTIQDCDGDQLLEFARGEEHIDFDQRPDGEACDRASGEGRDLRLPPSASIINFLQLSDFQVVDEESPARVEWLDATQRVPRLQPFSAAYRPQESLTTQIQEAMVRQARNTVSPVTGKRLELTILTGDNADSQQYNETRWFIDILDGTTGAEDPAPEMADPALVGPDGNVRRPARRRDRKVDPDSGIAGPDPHAPQPGPACEATPGSVYDGVRDSGQESGPDGGYYEPDGARDGDGYSPDPVANAEETPGRAVRVRDFPGLFEAANEPFEAVGLGMPWYSAFGNHDALVQGNSPEAYAGPLGPGPVLQPDAEETYDEAFHRVATGCVKVLQPAAGVRTGIDAHVAQIAALREGGVTPGEQAEIDRLTGQVLEAAGDVLLEPCDDDQQGCAVAIVPPDPRRCFLAKDELQVTQAGSPCQTGSWIKQHFRTTGTPKGHGFAPAPTAPTRCQPTSTDTACVQASYGRPPVADANHDGYYSFSPKPGLRFVVLDTVTDECGSEFCSEGSVDDPQFRWLEDQLTTAEALRQYVLVFSHHTLRTTRFVSSDPSEAPLHYGQRIDRENAANPQNVSLGETLEELYCRYPRVLAHVAGHEHANSVRRYCPAPGPGFWHISTAAHIDWPQQARMIELVELGGEMSFVLTMLDHNGPANAGGSGHAPDDVVRLAAIGRELAFNDYQGDREARGGRQDRNVILPTHRPPPAG